MTGPKASRSAARNTPPRRVPLTAGVVVAVAAMAGAILAGQGPLAIASLALTGGVLTVIVIARLGAAEGGAHAEKIDDERTPAPRLRELSSSTTDLERALDRELAV